MQRYVRVEEGRLEQAERSANTFMQALVEANETVTRQREEIERLNRLVETLSRAIGRYQDEESVPAPGSHPFIPLSGSQDTSGEYTRCSVMGCTQARIQHPGEW